MCRRLGFVPQLNLQIAAPVPPRMLQHLWSLVESTQAQTLLTLDDRSLVQWLLHQLTAQYPVDHQQADLFSHYIQSRLSLIRDLATFRATF
jgi:hypothetical protein